MKKVKPIPSMAQKQARTQYYLRGLQKKQEQEKQGQNDSK